jgi:bifunctional DNA-binding transcriptional regulator/antitoxin component of YhaV-PrlF toxin-antitoxin module
MTKVEMDSRGRIVIPKEYRMGQKEYRIVKFEDSIRLIPVPEDPIEDMRERTKGLRESDKSIEELKEEAIKDLVDREGE